mmetsp:Transcript_69950/g.193454  ORF Transcript_69950/g.193454 Transcript_69950/m.193454 type:complete len:382 (-) Transcript_69950:224-1369(-)
MVKGGARDRPRSKGSLQDGDNSQCGDNGEYDGVRGISIHAVDLEPRGDENAQRRIRSAENQHRSLAENRDGPHAGQMFASTPSASALDRYSAEDDVEQDIPHFHQGFQELKRPLSRKKDPSASAAAGLGAFAGPARMMDAFEQRKTRQPIPVESWGPRPPSRAGLPQKAAALDAGLNVRGSRCEGGASASVGRLASKASGDQALTSKGGPWASAWAEPRCLSSEARRGRDRKAPNRSSPEVAYAAADFAIFGVGAMGSFQPHAGFRSPQGPARPAGRWASHVGAAGVIEDGSSWPDSPALSCGSPPTRRGRHSLAEAVSVEDVEGDPDLGVHGSCRRDATPPQVIVTRSSLLGKYRGDIRRGSDQRAPGRGTSGKCLSTPR